MWRGVSVWTPILTGASMIRAGWLAKGKMVIYPIANDVDGQGRQLVNWVAELETPLYKKRDWNRPGDLRDFIGAFEDWHFDWLDVPALIRAADMILEFPMVDQDPLPSWTQGRVTLLGDAGIRCIRADRMAQGKRSSTRVPWPTRWPRMPIRSPR